MVQRLYSHPLATLATLQHARPSRLLYNLRMLLSRWTKRDSFMNHEFRKYLWYAVGEIVLVIAGIIIALQIDTWYDDKQAQARLDEYLGNIAHSVNDDIQRVRQLKTLRSDTMFESFSAFLATNGTDDGTTEWYNGALVASVSAALEKAQKKLYFVANSGSYRALESSGLIGQLSDTDVESMLYDYYRTADRITTIEQDMNNVLRELTVRFQTETARDVPQLILREPRLLWEAEIEPEYIEERELYRRRYWEIIADAVTHSLLRLTLNQSLMQEYEHLLSLGGQLVNRISHELNPAIPAQASAALYSPESLVGHPVLIEAGRPGYHSYGVFTAPTNSSLQHVYNSLWIADDALNVRYGGGEPWAYLYFKHGPIEIVVERSAKDYSVYDRMRLELKREANTECPELRLEIKDIDDAEKGGLRSVPLALTPEWQTYTVDLAEFVEADLTRLNVVAGFLFTGPQPCDMAIRDIRYLKPADDSIRF